MPGRRGYHHGNLRRALIDAILELVTQKGPNGFTMAEAARAAGVSAAAPYRHFKGQGDILAAAALEGYGIFADMLAQAHDAGKGGPRASFERVAVAYLEFATLHPGHYITMFESSLDIAAHGELATAAAQARAVMDRVAADLVAPLAADKRPPASLIAQHMWALCHGVVELVARGSTGLASPYPPEAVLETGLGIYLRGLGILPPD